MKGPFGLLLLGGGIILIVGLFTGKITFAVPGATPDVPSANQPGGAGTPILPDKAGKCPAGYTTFLGVCYKNSSAPRLGGPPPATVAGGGTSGAN